MIRHRQHSLASCAGEAFLVVGVPERGDHLALHVLVARRAARTERALVVLRHERSLYTHFTTFGSRNS